MEHIKNILPRVHNKLLEQQADMYAWDKMTNYITDLYDIYENIDYYQDPAEQQAAIEVYNKAYKDYLEKYSLENN